MSRSVNKATIVGHVGRDPEVRTTNSGAKVANTSVATSYKRGDEEHTDWHRLVVFGKLADVFEQWVNKGDRIYVEGRIQYGSYERDGATIPTTEIVVNELVMLGGRDGVTPQPTPAPTGAYDGPDLPFDRMPDE